MIAQCDIEEDIFKEAVADCVGRKIQMECQSKNMTARSIVIHIGVAMRRTFKKVDTYSNPQRLIS